MNEGSGMYPVLLYTLNVNERSESITEDTDLRLETLLSVHPFYSLLPTPHTLNVVYHLRAQTNTVLSYGYIPPLAPISTSIVVHSSRTRTRTRRSISSFRRSGSRRSTKELTSWTPSPPTLALRYRPFGLSVSSAVPCRPRERQGPPWRCGVSCRCPCSF